MRVTKNFDDKDLQAGIVIPSYDEGADILRTLHAWVGQMVSSGVRSALFIVVNNSKKSPRDVKASNKITHELVDALITQDLGSLNDLDNDQWEKFSQLKDLVEEVRCRLALIDLWSKHHAPEDCNVGMARDVGARIASEYVRDDGFLVTSDADTTPGKNYLFQADLYMRKNPEIAALKGDVYSDGPKNSQDRDRMTLFSAVQALEERMRLLARMHLGKYERKPFPHLSGSNGVVRKNVYEIVGGIPHINGAEDTELSRKILRKGFMIHNAGYRLSVDTSPRISLRTDVRHGMGQAMKEIDDFCHSPYNTPVLSLEACEFAETLAVVIADVNKDISGKTHWQSNVAHMMSERRNAILEDDDLEDLWKANQPDPMLTDIHFNRVLLKEIERIAEEFYEKIPFYRALAQLRGGLRLPPRLTAFYDYLREVKQELSALDEALNNEWYNSKILLLKLKPEVQEKSRFEDLESHNWFDDLLVALSFLVQHFLKKPAQREIQ